LNERDLTSWIARTAPTAASTEGLTFYRFIVADSTADAVVTFAPFMKRQPEFSMAYGSWLHGEAKCHMELHEDTI